MSPQVTPVTPAPVACLSTTTGVREREREDARSSRSRSQTAAPPVAGRRRRAREAGRHSLSSRDEDFMGDTFFF